MYGSVSQVAGAASSRDECRLRYVAILKIFEFKYFSSFCNDAEAVEYIRVCCMKFLSTLASQANKIAESEKKKELRPQHFQGAAMSLGFGSYLEKIGDVEATRPKVSLKHRSISILWIKFHPNRERESVRLKMLTMRRRE